MPYAIFIRIKPDHAHVWTEHRAAHLEYLDANRHRLLAAGGLIDDDGSGPHGAIILVDTDDRAEADAFVAEDPFTHAGLFEEVTVTRWRKSFFNYERLV